ncbi:MAG: family 43 glycosylhydrolase [Acidobacteriaceae bacterium]
MRLPLSIFPCLALALLFPLGCSSGGNNATSSSSGSGTTTSSPDFGTLTDVSDSTQFKIQNVSSGLLLSIAGQSQIAGAALAQNSPDGTSDQLWHFMPMGSQEFNVENLLTHQVIGITNASQQAGAASVQWADNGTPDHLWKFYLLKDGNYLIQNVNSGLYLDDSNSNATSSAVIDQSARATSGVGCTCQEWTLTSTGTSAYPAPLSVSGTGIYVHDPNMLKAPDGTYWLYGSHNTLASSTNLSTFVNAGSDFSSDFSWWKTVNVAGSNGRSDIWASDVILANGTYFQYYAIPFEPHNGPQAIIALATSSYPNGPWTDAGQIIESYGTTAGSTTTFNAIDPAPFVDSAGNWWMVFGSWTDGIHVLQLDPSTGLRLQTNPTLYTIAQRGNPSAGEEGPFIYPYNGWYYYFASINVCCSGDSSTYRIIVGRSKSSTGPYLDRGGLDLMQGGGTILLSAHGNINGPGGQSLFTDGTQPILVYHYYDGNNNGTPTLGINFLGFDADGWPYVE